MLKLTAAVLLAVLGLVGAARLAEDVQICPDPQDYQKYMRSRGVAEEPKPAPANRARPWNWNY